MTPSSRPNRRGPMVFSAPMRPLLLTCLVLLAATQTACMHRRCDTWGKAPCRAEGAVAQASPLRIYALGDAGRDSPARARALSLLEQVIASEPASSTRVLAVLGDNVHRRGMLSSDESVASAKAFYEGLFTLTAWDRVVMVPGNDDHGGFRHGGFNATAIEAQAAWLRAFAPEVVFPAAADPRADAPWVTVNVPGHEACVTLQAVDSQGFRENLLAWKAPASEAAWNLALAHHGTRTAANHMGDRSRDSTLSWAEALSTTDLVLTAHENVLFADLEPSGVDRPGPPNVMSGSFSEAKRLKAPQYTSCAAEQAGFVRLSVDGDALVADFFSVPPDGEPSASPYCTQRLVKDGAGARCGL